MSTGLVEGTVFAGRYRVERLIASGGMGAVYEVVHLETSRRRALKVMLPHMLESQGLRERFQLEARAAAAIESEFIVDVFDAGFDEPTQMPFLVMELLRGEELGKRVKRLGRLGPDEVVGIVHQVALALDKTHRAAIVHRDLKPENVFLTEREDGPPRVKVLDFGVAKVLAESIATGATQSLGTPLYMAPEQFNPSVRLTGATDLYALAMVTYKLLVGKAYWSEEAQGSNVFAVATVAMAGLREPASARAARRGVTLPPAFDAWFAHAAALDPAHRFPTGAEMAGALGTALGVYVPRGASHSMVGLTPFTAPPVPTSVAAQTPPPAPQAYAPPDTPAPAAPPSSWPVPTPISLAPTPAPVTAPGTTASTPSPPAATGPSKVAVIAVAAIAGMVMATFAVLWSHARTGPVAAAPGPSTSVESAPPAGEPPASAPPPASPPPAVTPAPEPAPPAAASAMPSAPHPEPAVPAASASPRSAVPAAPAAKAKTKTRYTQD